MFEMPDSLAGKLYLLAYDFERERLAHNQYFGYLLRAGVLAELLLDGAVRDENGKVLAVANSAKSNAPMIAETVSVRTVIAKTLRQIVESPGKSWRYWLRKDAKNTRREIVDRLVKQGVIRLHRNKVLGVLPTTKVTVTDAARAEVKRLGQHTKQVLRSQPVSTVQPFDAAVIALAAAGELTNVVNRAQRRDHRVRIEKFAELVSPIPDALRRLIRNERAAMSG